STACADVTRVDRDRVEGWLRERSERRVRPVGRIAVVAVVRARAALEVRVFPARGVLVEPFDGLHEGIGIDAALLRELPQRAGLLHEPGLDPRLRRSHRGRES